MKKILAPILAEGEFPHNRGIMQVVDAASLGAIENQQLPQKGILLDFDHYSGLTDDDKAELKRRGIQLPSGAAGWIKRLIRKAVNGVEKIFGEAELTDAGEAAVENGDYKFTSPVFPTSTLEHIGGIRFRPLSISKVALTNEPNIRAIGAILANREHKTDILGAAVEIANSDAESPVEKEDTTPKGRKMKEQIANLLKLDPNAADEVIVDAVAAVIEKNAALEEAADKAKAEAEEKAAADEEMKNRAEAAEAKLAEVEAAKAKADEDAKVSAELDKYPDLENREAAGEMLRSNFDKGAAFLATLTFAKKVHGKSPEDEIENRKPVESEPFGIRRIAIAFKK